MSEDLIFYLITRRKWKEWQKDGMLIPPDEWLEEGAIPCLSATQVEDTANEHFSGRRHLLLLVIHTTRLRNSIRWKKRNGHSYPIVESGVNLDAVIDKIPLAPDQDGRFHVTIENG